MPRERYDRSNEKLYTPVTVAEVARLRESKGRLLRDRYDLQHFLYRVQVTVHTHEEDVLALKKAVAAASEKKKRQGTPTTLSPLDAVKFASPEELSVIVGNISSSQLRALADLVEEARGRRDELAATLDTVRAAAASLARRDDLPATVRAEFSDLLHTLPPAPDPVTEPKALELGRMAGLIEDRGAGHAGALDAPGTVPLALEAPAPAGTGPTTGLAPVTDLACYGPPPAWQPGPGLIRHDKELP